MAMSSTPTRSRQAQRAHRDHLDAMGHMASGIANELRAPVLGISSAAQLLRFRATEDPVIEKNVGRILHEAERLNRMVASLLEYGRIEPLNLTVANPDDVWDRVLEQQRGALERRSLLVDRIRAPDNLKCAIDVDRLSVVFRHLIANAVEASQEAGDIFLASSGNDNTGWSCHLRNDGDVIAGDELSRVFDMFFTTRTGNAGIGLATARRLIEQHGGSIEITSIPQSGTTVSVALPAAV